MHPTLLLPKTTSVIKDLRQPQDSNNHHNRPGTATSKGNGSSSVLMMMGEEPAVLVDNDKPLGLTHKKNK